MALPTDRGFAVIGTNEDGTWTIQICTGFEQGRPAGVYARHVRAPAVTIDPAIRLAGTGTLQFTTQVVEVFNDAGTVTVRLPKLSLPDLSPAG